MDGWRRIGIAVVCVLAAGPAALGQGADAGGGPDEVRIYEVADLVDVSSDDYGPTIEMRPAAQVGGPAGASFTLEDDGAGRLKNLVLELVKGSASPESWEERGRVAELMDDGRLIVRHAPETQAGIERILAGLRASQAPPIAVEATLALVDDAVLERWRAPEGWPGGLSDDGARAMREAVARGDGARRIAVLRRTAVNGQRTAVWQGSQIPYVMDYAVETTTYAFADDPIVGYLQPGAVLDARPILSGDRVVSEVRFTHVDAVLPVPHFDTGVPRLGGLHLPEQTATLVETTVIAPPGVTVLAARVATSELRPVAGGVETPPGWSLCLFYRATPLGEASGVAMEVDEDGLGVLDLGMLGGRFWDRPGRSLGLNRGGGGIIDEGDDLPSWSDRRLAALLGCDGGDGDAVGRGPRLVGWGPRPAVLARGPDLQRVAEMIRHLTTRRIRAVGTRVELLALDPARYASLRKDHAAFRGGGAAVPAETVRSLLAEAGRGGEVVPVGGAEVVGGPGQRVNVDRVNQRAIVEDYAVEMCGGANPACLPNPLIEVVEEGLVLDCRARPSADGAAVDVELAISIARFVDPPEPVVVGPEGARAHRVNVDVMPMRASFTARAGEWTVPAATGPVRVGGTERMLVALVKCEAQK